MSEIYFPAKLWAALLCVRRSRKPGDRLAFVRASSGTKTLRLDATNGLVAVTLWWTPAKDEAWGEVGDPVLFALEPPRHVRYGMVVPRLVPDSVELYPDIDAVAMRSAEPARSIGVKGDLFALPSDVGRSLGWGGPRNGPVWDIRIGGVFDPVVVTAERDGVRARLVMMPSRLEKP